MKLLPQLRIPWVARRWHDAELAAKARLLDGCMEARRQDAERHGRLMRARDAEIVALAERVKIAERSASDLRAECSARARTLSRTLSKLVEVEKDRDLARSTEETLRTSISAQKRQIAELTAERRDAQADAAMWKDEHDKANERLREQIDARRRSADQERERREREIEDILDLIEAARDYVLERRSCTPVIPAETENAA